MHCSNNQRSSLNMTRGVRKGVAYLNVEYCVNDSPYVNQIFPSKSEMIESLQNASIVGNTIHTYKQKFCHQIR